MTTPLGSLARDIAHAVDAQSLADFWERRERGDPTPSPRWLYTPRGQEIFREIQDRYDTDSSFREAADRYVADFDRLIARVLRGEGGPATARSYQMSDTGKAYLMLAHASGNLD